MTWWPGWDYLMENAKGWADSYIWLGADSYIWLGIGCLALLAVFEIIERNARGEKQHTVADANKGVATPKQRQVGGRRRSNRPLPRRKTA